MTRIQRELESGSSDDLRIMHLDHELPVIFHVTNIRTIIPPLQAGEGRGEGESFERKFHRFMERAFFLQPTGSSNKSCSPRFSLQLTLVATITLM